MINESNSQVLENLYSLPIPLSLMILPFLISLLHRYQFMLISIYLVTVFDWNYIYCLSTTIKFFKLLECNSILLPMFGLIIGEIVGKINLYQKLFLKLILDIFNCNYFTIIATITYDSNNLASNIFGIYIYQVLILHLQYSS